MINLIISKSPRDLSHYVYEKIEEDLDNHEKSFLIVPEQYTLQSDINLMDNISYKTVMDAKVLSFSSLSKFILDRTGGIGEDFLSKSGKVMLITTILRDMDESLTLFKGKYHNIDFVNDIERLITNIKDNHFDEEFFKTIDETSNDEILKLKFKETKLIYEAYQKEIADKYLDSEDRVNEVIGKLAECDFLRGANFYFDKFDYISDIKMDFIDELNRIGAKINVALTLYKAYLINPLAKDIEIYDMAIKFYYNLKNIDIVNEIDLNVPLNPNPDINHLCQNFERYNASFYENTPSNIHVLESVSTKTEVENIGLLINRLVKEENLRYKDIAIYTTDADEYDNEITKIFNRYQIPVFMDKTSTLSDNHIIKTYLALLRMVIYDFNIFDLAYFLRSGIYDFGENSNEKVILFQNYTKVRQIKGSMFLNDKYFAMDEDFYSNLYKDDPDADNKFILKQNEFTIINEIRDELLKLLEKLIDLRENSHPVKEIVTAIYETVADEKFFRGIDRYQNILLEENELDNYRENDQVWDKFMEILEELVGLMGDRKNTLKGVYKLILASASDIDIGIIPPTKDHVIVTNFRRPRVSERAINFALGMNDAFFPSKSRTDFLLGKDDKEKLIESGLDLKIYEEDVEEREKLNLYKMITSSNKIYFSVALSKKNGEALNKSLVLNGVLNIFPKLKISDLTSLSSHDLIYSKELTQKIVLESVNKIKKGEDLGKNELEFIRTYLAYLKNYGNFEKVIDGIYYTNAKKNIESNIAKKMYGKSHFSITEIETYSKCPYRYFINYGIKPSYDETYDVNARELGSIVHNSLEDVTRLIKDYDLDEITSEDLDQLISDNFNHSIDNYMDKLRRNDPRNRFILDNLAKNTTANSKEVINQLKKGEFKVSDVEVDFGYGKDGDLPPVYVDDQNYLRGRIDRIDSYENYIRIIDYKTGSKTFKILNVLNGLDLQLLVYMMSTENMKDKFIPIGSFYMPLSDELKKMDQSYGKDSLAQIYEDKFKMNGLLIKVDEEVFKLIDKENPDLKNMGVIDRKNTDVISPEDEKVLSIFAKNLVSKYVKEIKMGNIKLHPLRYSETQNECQYCDFKGICKFDESIDADKYRDFDKSLGLSDLKEVEGADD